MLLRRSVHYETGCTNHRLLPILNPEWTFTDTTQKINGFRVDYFDSTDLSNEPVFTTKRTYMDLAWVEPPSPDMDLNRFSARFTSNFTPPADGTYTFGIMSGGSIRLWVDGKSLVDNWLPSPAEDHIFRSYDGEMVAACELSKGKDTRIQMDFSTQDSDDLPRRIRLGCLPPFPADAMDRAAEAAAKSDVALVYVGTSNEWETEGRDRPDMELPGRQAELIVKVAHANPNTVVILNTGSPVSMDWIEKVPAVLEAWFPGQEGGNAIADIVFGKANPSGKLPQTFPVRLEDNPAFINYPGENGKVHYGEGIFVGYRYFEKKKIQPRFAFGHGLSYTTFQYSNLKIKAGEFAPEDQIEVCVDVTNTGDRLGKEVVQLYIRDPESSLVRPEKELKAFEKVLLAPGQTKTIEFTLNQRSLAFYDPAQKKWIAEPGLFQVLVGGSSQDIRLTGSFILKAEEAH